MSRRRFIAGVVLAVTPLGATASAQEYKAQQAEKVRRIGVATEYSPAGSPRYDAFRQGLHELGWVDGHNITIEWRWAQGRSERFPDLAAELVSLKVDVIVASINPAVQAAQRATKTIPIVMVYPTDPVALGFVASLARPGGNITGLTSQSPELAGKRLELLKETLPNLRRAAVLWDPSEPGRRGQVSEVETAARAAGVRLRLLEARTPSELDSAFTAITREGVGALLVQSSSMLFVHRARIADLATKSGVPAVCPGSEYVESGCPFSYGTNFNDLHRRAATYVDKILKGAKPADLPIEQPTKFELVINLKTAKAIGLTIPQSVLGRADQVIE